MKTKKKLLVLGLALSLLVGCGEGKRGEHPSSEANVSNISSSLTESRETLSKEDLQKLPLLEEGTWIVGQNDEKWYKNKGTFYDAFDTVIQLTGYTKDEETFKQAFSLCQSEFQRLHKLFDNYHEYDGITNIMTLNRKASKEPIVVDDELFSLLQFCKEQNAKTQGKVNIAMGKTLALWHDLREAVTDEHEHAPVVNESDTIENRSEVGEKGAEHAHDLAERTFSLPTKEALEEANQHSNLDNLVLDEANKTVLIRDSALQLDAGAVAKGYATELVARKLKSAGLEHGLISAGGNIKTIGNPVDGRAQWKVGIMHPRPEQKDVLATVLVSGDTAMVTSGDYQRYFELDGVRYAHIIDPVTLYPATRYTSVSIRTADSGLADYLSTVFFIADETEAQQILANYADAGVDVIWVDQQMNVMSTPGIKPDIELVP